MDYLHLPRNLQSEQIRLLAFFRVQYHALKYRYLCYLRGRIHEQK